MRRRKVTPERRERILNELASLENEIYPFIQIVKTYNFMEATGGIDNIPGVNAAEFTHQYHLAKGMALSIRQVMADMAQDIYTLEEHQAESVAMVERLDIRLRADFAAWNEAQDV